MTPEISPVHDWELTQSVYRSYWTLPIQPPGGSTSEQIPYLSAGIIRQGQLASFDPCYQVVTKG